jgi:hypothetical protein
MPKLAILIPGSANAAFYSQIAAISLALRKIEWRTWEPEVHAFFGDNCAQGDEDFAVWQEHLTDVEVFRVSRKQFDRHNNWAQVDATMRLAPRDADVLLSLDADTLPVRNFEDILDRVLQEDGIAGVLAHYPFPGDGASSREDWARSCAGLLEQPLPFDYSYSLMTPQDNAESRAAPFYLNGGVVFYSQKSFGRFFPSYVRVRHALMKRLPNPDFSAQVGMTIAMAEEGIRAIELPMRYNFPNDPLADALHAGELQEAVFFHYLRTSVIQRHQIFTDPVRYQEFLSLPLSGVNDAFRQAVRRLFGTHFPFAHKPEQEPLP